MKILLKDGYVISGRKDCEAVKADILTENGKIKKIGTVTDGEAQVIDCSGKYIMPGLVNLHAHLFGTGKPSAVLAGGPAQKMVLKLSKTTVGKAILDSLAASAAKAELHSGVTTLRTSGDFQGADIRLREKIKSGKVQGPRLFCPGPAITAPTGHGDGTFAETATEPADFAKLVDERRDMGADYIKICTTGGVMDAKEKGYPGQVKMTYEQTKAVCDRAHQYGMKVASHTQSTKGMEIAITGGVDTLEHGADFGSELQAILKARGGAVVPTFSPAVALNQISPEITKLNEICVYNSGVVTEGMMQGCRTAMENGVPVGLGTDASCPFAAQYNMWREVWLFKELMGVSASTAIYTATLSGAEILGIDGETGSLEEGKQADMMILPSNPLSDLEAMREPYAVVLGGKVIYPNQKKSSFVEDQLDQVFAKLKNR
ncbi:MAG: amidohydrolase family protein [Acutalibacteraceae bacterium]